MPTYAVFSSDHDEQQGFCDIQYAESLERAEEIVLKRRDHCCHAQAWTAEKLRELANQCDAEE
jgi:hypothetical protein